MPAIGVPVVFSDPDFLFFFLPAVLGAYFLLPKGWRNIVLLVASWAFYTAGSGALIVLLLISTVTDYIAGRLVGHGLTSDQPRLVKLGVTGSVVLNLGLLAYFKYANFFVDQLDYLAEAFGGAGLTWSTVVLPIGISFYTFQSMSYTIDVARGRVEPVRNPLDFALYVALFPQLIAGPIVRYHEIADEIQTRTTRLDDFAEGALRFAHGLIKKVVIADSVALIVDSVFGLPTEDLTTAAAWIGVLAYTVQIYFDFSGYSDMAIGLGRIFGFHFPENFRRPYSALSITDFWRRWHITLSNWFRDYLYIPLGGSKGSTASTYRNLVIVFLLTGLWHGANWTFVVWGAYHGTLLVIERVTGQRPVGDRAPNSWLRRGLVFLAVILGWVVFRADSLGQAFGIYEAMFTWSGLGLPPEVELVVTTRAIIALAIGLATVVLPRTFVGGISIPHSVGRRPAIARFAMMFIVLPYALTLTVSGSFSPFLYYQF